MVVALITAAEILRNPAGYIIFVIPSYLCKILGCKFQHTLEQNWGSVQLCILPGKFHIVCNLITERGTYPR